MKLILPFFLLFALGVNSDALLIKDLPLQVIEDIFTILVFGTVHVVGNCTIDPQTPEFTYWLSTKAAPDYVQLQNLDTIDPSKPVILIAHGWHGNRSSDYIIALRDAYNTRYDANIIVLDYGNYAAGDYFSSYCYMPKIAENFAKSLCDLNAMVGLENVHIVGHSMGGQLAGIAGVLTQKMCATIGRITGLDPAGPLYEGIDKDLRLDKTDALFVDIIHTNQAQYGYLGEEGHIDFYPNCGYFQPGCPKLIITSIKDILNLPLEFVICNHKRSNFLFAESINRNNFKSTSCITCGLPICGPDLLGDHTYMGESCRRPQKRQKYFLRTSSRPPYGVGPAGPLS